MDLAGKLTTLGLAEVFQNLAFSHHTGTLTLKLNDKRAFVAFENGRIRASKVEGKEIDYVDLARRWELAADDVLQKAAGTNRRRTLKAYLLGCGALDEARFDAAVGDAASEQLLPLFGWKAASFQFEEGNLKERLFDKEQLGAAIDLDPMAVAMEAARRHDEWETIQEYVPTEKEVLVHTGVRPDMELPAGTERLLPLFDGTRHLGAVMAESRLKEFNLFKAVAGLVEMGVLVPATADRVRELAAQARTAGKITLAAQRLEVALKLDPTDLATRTELVLLHERAGRLYDAARELVKTADMQIERGDLEGALESFERASVLAPQDLDILERILGLHEQRGDQARALKVGRRLAEALVQQKMYEDALPLYERLLKSNEGNTALQEAIAAVRLALNEPKKAAAHLLAVADAAYERDDFRAARRAYKQVLVADEKNAKAKERLQDIESGEAQARLDRRRRWKRLAAYSLVAAAVVYVGVREWLAQDVLNRAHNVTVAAFSRDNTDTARAEALKRYIDVAQAYPFTHTAKLSRDAVHSLVLAEIARIDGWLGQATDARTTAEIEATLGRAESHLRRLDEIGYEGETLEAWDESRDRLRSRIAKLLER
jgi:tetratricopeptide (TPR) repeat protein